MDWRDCGVDAGCWKFLSTQSEGLQGRSLLFSSNRSPSHRSTMGKAKAWNLDSFWGQSWYQAQPRTFYSVLEALFPLHLEEAVIATNHVHSEWQCTQLVFRFLSDPATFPYFLNTLVIKIWLLCRVHRTRVEWVPGLTPSFWIDSHLQNIFQSHCLLHTS